MTRTTTYYLEKFPLEKWEANNVGLEEQVAKEFTKDFLQEFARIAGKASPTDREAHVRIFWATKDAIMNKMERVRRRSNAMISWENIVSYVGQAMLDQLKHARLDSANDTTNHSTGL